MSSESFEEKLRERFAQAQIHPPADLWDRIEGQMAPLDHPPKRLLWLWWPLAALLVVGSLFGWNHFVSDSPSTSPSPSAFAVIPAEDDSVVNSTNDAPDRPHQAPPSLSAATPLHSSLPTAPRVRSDDSVSESPKFRPSPPVATPASSSDQSMSQGRATHGNAIDSSASLLSVPASQDWTMLPQADHVTVDSALLFRAEQIEPIPPFWAKGSNLLTSPAIISAPNAKRISSSRWTLDLSMGAGHAIGLPSGKELEYALRADYVSEIAPLQGQSSASNRVASLRFPRWQGRIALEAGYTFASHWRVSLGLEGLNAWKGTTNMNLVQLQGPANLDDLLNGFQNVANAAPNDFHHASIGVPLRVSHLSHFGAGTWENALGFTLYRSWIRASQDPTFSMFNRNDMAFIPGTPDPLLLSAAAWHSDLRLRTRYVFPSGRRQAFFVGLEFQHQLIPAFQGEAASTQPKLLLGAEVGIRFR